MATGLSGVTCEYCSTIEGVSCRSNLEVLLEEEQISEAAGLESEMLLHVLV